MLFGNVVVNNFKKILLNFADLKVEESQGSLGSNEFFPTPPEIAIQDLNKGLVAFNQSPIFCQRDLRSQKVVAQKIEKTKEVM